MARDWSTSHYTTKRSTNNLLRRRVSLKEAFGTGRIWRPDGKNAEQLCILKTWIHHDPQTCETCCENSLNGEINWFVMVVHTCSPNGPQHQATSWDIGTTCIHCRLQGLCSHGSGSTLALHSHKDFRITTINLKSMYIIEHWLGWAYHRSYLHCVHSYICVCVSVHPYITCS